MKISCMQHRHKEGKEMAVAGVTGIDSVEDLYLKTYAKLKAVSEEAAASFAQQVKLSGAAMDLNAGDTSSSLSAIDNIQDTYVRTINTIKAAQNTTSGIYNANGIFTSSVLGSNALAGSVVGAPSIDVDSFLESAVKMALNSDQQNLLSQIQDTFRANTTTIVDTMQALGLTFNDLATRENMVTLGDALNNRAIEYGLPAVENVDASVDMLYDGFGEGAGSGGNGAGTRSAVEDVKEEYSNIIVEGDKTYLETVTIENGVKTVVRTEMNR